MDEYKDILRPRAIRLIKENLGKRGSNSNCWATTLYSVGAIKKLRYISSGNITKWIKDNTIKRRRRKPKRGDIIVFTVGLLFKKKIVHTAIYLGNGVYFHQRGWRGPWEMCDLDRLFISYGEDYYYSELKDRRTWKKVDRDNREY